ncbi:MULTISPECIES: YitT family protein [unclassified Bilifractor]|uniref:YitT family protein n=1 Tax=unclassified Bilifractor TaxID=2815795 RepID=UPI002A86E478|nr:YitT family protein [Eubacterium sp.]MDY5113063.1 YitT family protein [Bilifractor sp.]
MHRIHLSQSGKRYEAQRIMVLLLGTFIYAVGINFFIVPAGLYTGGVLGLCQLLRSFLTSVVGLRFGSVDVAGILYYLVNIPFLILAHKLMGKLYFAKTILGITAESVFLVLLPVPRQALVDNRLAAALIGGVICGAMMGLMLRMGACDGGMDLIGVLIVHQRNGASVGHANLYVNIVVFAIMAFNYPIDILIYSLFSAFITSYALDRFYSQNIKEEFHIITQQDVEALEKSIIRELRRSVTRWEGKGGFSGNDVNILYVIVDKYEAPRLRRLVREFDPDAFVVENSGVNISGNFEKHLE